MATTDFVELWSKGDNSFEEDPPNAVLAFLEPGDEVPEDAVVVIQDPRLEGGHLTYSIRPSRVRSPLRLVPSRCALTHSDDRSRRYRSVGCVRRERRRDRR